MIFKVDQALLPNLAYSRLGAIAHFDSKVVSSTKPLLARVGISFISEAQACHNGETEIPNFDFDGVRQTAKQLWNTALSRVVINGGTADQRKLFYSSVCAMFSLAILKIVS